MEVRSSSSLSVSEWAGRGVPQKQVSTVGMASVSGAGAGAELDAAASMLARESAGTKDTVWMEGESRRAKGERGAEYKQTTIPTWHLTSSFSGRPAVSRIRVGPGRCLEKGTPIKTRLGSIALSIQKGIPARSCAARFLRQLQRDLAYSSISAFHSPPPAPHGKSSSNPRGWPSSVLSMSSRAGRPRASSLSFRNTGAARSGYSVAH